MPPPANNAVPTLSPDTSSPPIDVNAVLQDPNFHALPMNEKQKVLLKDPNYAGLPPQEMQKVLQQIQYPNPVSLPTDSGQPNSILGGAGRAVAGAAKGAWSTLMAPPSSTDEKVVSDIAAPLLPAYRMGKGLVSTEATAGKQALGQAGSAIDAAKAGQVGPAAAQAARAVVSGASMLDPFATGSVVNANKMQDEGRQREAIGSGAVDVLSLIAGSQLGKPLSAQGKLAKLTSAVGETGETAKNLKSVLPDLADTAAATGKPSTIGEFQDLVSNTKKGLDTQFNQALQPVRFNLQNPISIHDALINQITPNMAKTAAGQAEAQALRDAAADFTRPWSNEELNGERMSRNADLRAYYSKESGAQNAALKSRVQVLIDKTVRDEATKLVYGAVDQANPGINTTLLKQKQSALWDIDDQLSKRVGKLQDKQLAVEGQTIGEKLRGNITAPLGSGSIRSRITGLQDLIPGRAGVEDYANMKVERAFNPVTASGAAGRSALLSLPLTHLVNPAESKIPPPPPPAQ